MRNIKILMHTHWDREWYFTKNETQVLLKHHMIEVIEYLEKNRDIIYVLDGQSVMIDDFLEIAPKWKERLEKLVKGKQLKVGPWYTQTDLLLVNGESIIRNLYYGIKKAKEFGDCMNVGYAPDTFGHSGQMPQIYKQFGIESSFFWRGFSELKADKSDFLWKGIDGSIIYGVNLSTGYQGGKYLEEDKNLLRERMGKLMNVLDKYSATSMRLIMNGHDQMPIQKDIKNVVKNIKEFYPKDKVSIDSFESYVDGLKEANLEIVSGELNHSKHARIHKTITSTRMDIKLLNTELENKIFNILEPLGVIGREVGIEYPYETIEKGLKELFGVHAHDSIGGCNSDLVNQDIKQRLINTKELIDTEIELYMRRISAIGKLQDKDEVITVYNLLPYKRENEFVELELITREKDFQILDNNSSIPHILLEQEIIDAGLIDRQVAARLLDIKVYKSKILLKLKEINGLSVKYLTYKSSLNRENKQRKESKNYAENQYYKLEIKDNKINLYDKISGKEYKNIIYIESSGDGGDSYDYSPPYKDMVLDWKNVKIDKISLNKSEIGEILEAQIRYELPKNQESREKSRLDQEMLFAISLTLEEKNKIIKASIKTQNKVCDTRFRIVLNTGILTKEAVSDSHLSRVVKPVYLKEELSVWEIEKWAEKPVSIETYNSYVSLEDKETSNEGTIYTYGLKEYEVIDGKIFITLFRTFSHLGKRELINRPGRPSGIEIETPDNQMIGEKFDFKLGFSLIEGDKSKDEYAREFLTPIIGYQLKEFNRFNINKPENKKRIDNYLNLELNGLVVSSLKMREDSDEIFIRIFNPEKEKIKLEFKNETYLSNMLEEKKNKIVEYQLHSQGILNIILIR